MKKGMMFNFDMDGVLVNLEQHLLDCFGKTWDDFKHYGKDQNKEAWALFGKKQDLFLEAPKTEEADELVDFVLYQQSIHKFEVGVLTAIPLLATMPEATLHKMWWIEKHFPRLLKNFKTGPHAKDKYRHANPGDVLLDDMERNILQWNAAGGIGVLHERNTLQPTLDKLKSIF